MEVRVLGPLQVLQDGREVTPGGRLQRTVFLRLLLDANRTVSPDRLAEDVLEDEALLKDPSAFAQVHISRLRKALARGGPGTAGLIVNQRPGYSLRLGPDDVDAWSFERLASEGATALAAGRPEPAAAGLQQALALWRGPALADVAYLTFARPEIIRLEEIRVAVMVSLYEAKLALGATADVVAELQGLVSEHPLRESLWALLMRALYLDGRQTEALRAFQELREMLDAEVGLSPSVELKELELAILSQDPTLGCRPPTPSGRTSPTLDPARRGSLPRPLTRFVGRQAARTELMARLFDTRLLTLKGMAGVGKTRLAMEVCAEAQASVPGGAWLAELAPLADPELVLPAVASAIGVRAEPGIPLGEALARAIGDQAVLVMLDNCEHLLQACAELAWNLLQSCPNLRIMATSQEVLGIPGEAVWPVPPLSVPAGDAEMSPAEIAGHEYEAVQLFCDRAALVQPDFSVHEGNWAAVATICRRLDGLPLAIELAAARVTQLAVEEIAELLDDRFNLLTGGSRWVPGRHQTLVGAVEWSHDLLADAERVLLRRLSVFVGGATVGAVEEVCAGETVTASEVFDLLGRLVAKSLVVTDTAGRQARYRLLETIRHYAAGRLLEAGEHSLVAERHARWCVGLAERAEPELTGASQYEWNDRLAAEADNLRAALSWAVAERQEDVALRLSAALTPFWKLRHWQEGREWLERSLAIGASAQGNLRARALWGVGELSLMGDDNRGAAVAAIESLTLCRASGDRRGEARARSILGRSGESHGGMTALQSLEEAARLARQVGDLGCLTETLATSGWAQLHRGELILARPFLEEAVSVAKQAGDEVRLAPMMVGLGCVHLFGGDLRSAEAILGVALALCRKQENVSGLSSSGISATLIRLAEVAMAGGDYDSPRSLLSEALDRASHVSGSLRVADCLYQLGRVELDTGEFGTAEGFFRRAQGLVDTAGATASRPRLGLARVSLARGDPGGAKTLLAGALEHARQKNNVLAVIEVVVSLGEVALAEEDLDEAMSCHRWTLTRSADVGNLPRVATSLDGFARVALRRHRPDGAARMFGAAESLRSALGLGRAPVELHRHEVDIAMLRECFTPEKFTESWAEGARLSVVEAVDWALNAAGVA